MISTQLLELVPLLTVSIFVSVSDSQSQRELQFKVNNNVPGHPRIIPRPKGFELQCGLKGLNGATVRENLAIISEQNQLSCSVANSVNDNNCRWVNVSEGLSFLTVTPPAPGVYTCQCLASKPCIPDIKPISALVYFIDPSKLAISTPDNAANLDIPTLLAANRTSFTLICNLTASVSLPLPDAQVFTWYRNGKLLSNDIHNKINGSELVVTLATKNPNDSSRYSGMYMCETTLSQATDGPLRAVYEVRGAPLVKATAQSQNKVEGDRVTITCDFDGQPPPEITWVRDGDKHMPDGRISTGYADVSTATLSIENLVPDDDGYYFCKTGTSAEAKTLLRVRSKLAPLWPFLGIVAELLVLAAIIIIHEKRCVKKDEDEENDDGGERKRSPASSNNEDSGLRNRKA